MKEKILIAVLLISLLCTGFAFEKKDIRYLADGTCEEVLLISETNEFSIIIHNGKKEKKPAELVLKGDQLFPAGTEGLYYGNNVLQDNGPQTPILIGDSRTFYLYQDLEDKDIFSWAAESGQGITWMEKIAVPAIGNNVNGRKIFILMGVNDILFYGGPETALFRYNQFLHTTALDWKNQGAEVYFVSVNPVTMAAPERNQEIDAFNQAIQAVMPEEIVYANMNHFLKETGYGLTDSLHYDNVTNHKIAQYLMQYK